MPIDDCPNDEILTAFNLGNLSDELLERVALHMDACSRCEARASRTDDKVDPVIATLRRTLTGRVGAAIYEELKEGTQHVLADKTPWKGNGSSHVDHDEGKTLAAGPTSGAVKPNLAGYEVGGILGSGGMGVVYKARHLRLNRVVALKMMAGDARRVSARFRVEAEAVARLQHPNIVQIFEIGDHDGQPFLALEFVEGGSLEQKYVGTPAPPRPIAALMRELALATDYAHRHGIVHRDLKPSNILLTPEGVPKLTDFGVAKRLEFNDTWSRDGDIIGTPRYMAPEQASGKSERIGPATDIYSLGVILYELLTGRVPQQAATMWETLALVCEQEPVAPRRLQPRLPVDLETIVLKCLRKEPAKRYSRAKDLADDLDRFLAGKPILARPVGWAERGYKWAKRHPTLSCLILVAALGLATTSFIGWRYNAMLRWYNGQLKVAAKQAKLEADRAKAARKQAQENALAEAEQRRQAEAALYFSRIGLAESELRNDNVAGAELILDECLPRSGQADPRGWEWRYLKRLCHTDLMTLRGHEGWVHDVEYSPDGRHVVAAVGSPYLSRTRPTPEAPGAVKVWDSTRGTPLSQLNGSSSAAWSMAYRPDGRQLASGHADGSIYLWDTEKPRRVLLRQGTAIRTVSVRFSPDGRTLAVGDDRSLTLWDVESRRQQRSLSQGTDQSLLAFSPDGTRLVAAAIDGEMLEVYNVAKGEVSRVIRSPRDRIKSLAYSPDGHRLATSNATGHVVIWDAESGEVAHRLRGHSGESTCVAFSPDGRQLASGGVDQTVRLWAVGDGSERRVFRGHTFGVRAVTFSPDGERVASSGQDGAVKVWDVTWDPSVLVYQRERQGGEWVGNLLFSAEGNRLNQVRHDKGILLTWNTAHGILETEYPIDITGRDICPRTDTTLSVDGQILVGVTRGDASVIKVWDVASGREIQIFKGHRATVTSVAISPDGKRVASACHDAEHASTVETTVWSIATGQVLTSWTVPAGSVIRRLVFSPDGLSLISGHQDGTLRVWDAATGRANGSLPGHREAINDLAFSPDGRQLASVDHADPTLRIWDLASRRCQFALKKHNHPLTSVAYSPDGRLVASVGYEGVVKLWDAKTGRDVLTLRGFGPRRPGDSEFDARVVFSRDGTRIVSNGWDGRLNVWDAPEESVDQREAEERATRKRAFAWHLRGANPSLNPLVDREFGDKFHLKIVTNTEPPDEPLKVKRARLFSRLGQWDKADADIIQVLNGPSNADVRLWYEHACLRYLMEDHEGYSKACSQIVERFATTTDPVTALFAARACTVPPDGSIDPGTLARWKQLTQAVASDSPQMLHLLGLMSYRAGHCEEAVHWIRQALQTSSKSEDHATDHLLLALAYQRLGDTEKARSALDQARSVRGVVASQPNADIPMVHTLKDVHDLLAYRILYLEATKLRAQEKPKSD